MLNKRFLFTFCLLPLLVAHFSVSAAIKQLRIINQSTIPIFIHKGGYSPSIKIEPKQWHIFPYPFTFTKPNTDTITHSTLLVATAKGRWITTPNGYTYLDKPSMILCLNYGDQQHTNKTGNRTWRITNTSKIDPKCKVKGYKQTWYQPQEL